MQNSSNFKNQTIGPEFRLRRSAARGILAILIALFACALAAQETESVETADQDAQGTYLDRHIAFKEAPKLQDLTIKDIQKLKILIANFGSKVEGAEADFEKIKTGYKEAQKLWYKRHFIESRNMHVENRKLIHDLFEKFAKLYDSQSSELLGKCSEMIANLEFSQSIEPGKEIDHNTLIQQNSYKLQIAFQQNHRAIAYVQQHDFDNAIHHFRLAKLFSIEVLKGLEQDTSKRDEMEKTYAADVQDARGFIVRNTAAK
ncbi:MAG: hypothetical protein KDK39_11220 [Leptospiraceae bacterium]|nr:hypothetical protein [Leptospiraceae bacterium]